MYNTINLIADAARSKKRAAPALSKLKYSIKFGKKIPLNRGHKTKVNTVKIIKIRPTGLEIDIFCQALNAAHKCIEKKY
jgi:hypothetical protein